ncbi:hypothetical protein [Planococcus plakortidis]|uniref:hypothetical protein n=1 Tax=Planococcus plakortidis TaxID=1038856 RepID=UPI00385998E9
MVTEMNEITEVAKENSNARVLMKNLSDKMAKRGIKYKEHEKELLQTAFHLFMYEGQVQSPTVIAFPPSFGKSTALIDYAVYMAELAPLYGALIVKDTREQVTEYAEEVNLKAGRMVCYPLLGKTDEQTLGEYRTQFEASESFPFVVMTKAMFQVRSNMQDLKRFAFWRDSQGNSRRRATLFFDEPPIMENTTELNSQDISKVLETVRQLSFNWNGSKDSYYKLIKEKAPQLREILENEDFKKGYFEAVDSSFRLPEKLKRDFSFKFSGNESDLLTGFEQMINSGGYKLQTELKASLSVTYKAFGEWTAFNPIILDGTGHIDGAYKKHSFSMLTLEEAPEQYNNVLIKYYSSGGSYSKTNLRNKRKEAIDNMAKIAREISANYESTMVVTHKEFYYLLNDELAQEITDGKIQMKYYDNGRSTNAYDKCDSAIFFGELNKGEQFYHSVARYRADASEELEGGLQVGRGGNSFSDSTVQEVYLNDSVIQRLQEMHRLRPRNKDSEIVFHFVGKNDELLKVAEHLEGSKVEEFKPKAGGLIKPTAKELFSEWLQRFATDEKSEVKAKEVYSEILSIERETFSRLKKDPEILALMDSLGIEFQGQKIIK